MRRGSVLEDTTACAEFLAALEHDAGGAAVLDEHLRDTRALVRISAPASRAADAIACEIAPVPPRANPHERNAPSISPM